MCGNTVVIAVTLAIGGKGCTIAYFSHSARTVHGVPLCAQLSAHCFGDLMDHWNMPPPPPCVDLN